MMTFLPTNSTPITEKRSFDLSSTSQEQQQQQQQPPHKKMKTTSHIDEKIDKDTSFSSKMIIQLAKSAIASLIEPKNSKIGSESPLSSLAHTISLPSNNPNAITSQNLSLLISQLTSEIARFDSSDAQPLLYSILRINWLYHSSNHDNFSKHYATFLTVLVSTIPSWWNEVALKIISDFIKSDPKELYSHHETLRKLISLAPTSSNILPNLLKSNFPNKNSPKNDIVNYVKNILYLSEYYNVLVSFVWTLIFENFIKIDVELQNQIDDVDDDDLPEALGLDDSDDEDSDSQSDADIDDDDDGDLSDRSDIDENSDDDDDDDDGGGGNGNDNDTENNNNQKTVKLNLIENTNLDSDNESIDENSTKLSKVIKKVKFKGHSSNNNNNNDDDDDNDEFDDEMLDSEAEYAIELESLSELSSKLDILLSSLLTYLKPNLSINSLESGQGIPTFNALTSAFRSMLLPTHGTRATQYIIFYAAQQQPELIDAFLVFLFEIVFSGENKGNESLSSSSISSNFSHNLSRNSGNMHARITGIQYIASFVARASNLSNTQIVSVVTFLVDYCTAYMEEHDDDDDDDDENMNNGSTSNRNNSNRNNQKNTNKEFNPTKHSIFYSLVQALMYIVCFRKDSLRETENADTNIDNNEVTTNNKSQNTGWAAALDRFFTRVIVSKYDPLRWCNETVVLIFSRVAQSEGICYTWSVVERIKRERVGRVANTHTESNEKNSGSRESTPVSSLNLTVGTLSSMRATQEFLDLVAFFPFDPLLLKKSRKIVEESYVEWDNGDDNDESE